MFTGLGKLPSHYNSDLKISPEFPRGFPFHLQPNYPRGSPPPITTTPRDSPRNLRDFARWEAFELSPDYLSVITKSLPLHTVTFLLSN